MPNSLTVEKIKSGNSNLRNPILVSYAAKGILPYHGLGSGIGRALRNWPDIEFIDDRDGCLFTARIHRKNLEQLVLATDSPTLLPTTRDGMSGETEVLPTSSGEMSVEMSGEITRKILESIDRDDGITIPNLAERLSVTTRTVERHIAALRRVGRLGRIGPTKGGKWEILR